MEEEVFRILLIEDNPGDEIIISETLKSELLNSVIIEQYYRLSSALENLRNRRFDLIILDLCLPDSIGLDTVDAVISVSGSLPIFVLTGMEDEFLYGKIMQMGVRGFCIKEDMFNPEYLRPVITEIKKIISGSRRNLIKKL